MNCIFPVEPYESGSRKGNLGDSITEGKLQRSPGDAIEEQLEETNVL